VTVRFYFTSSKGKEYKGQAKEDWKKNKIDKKVTNNI